ncbi:hypothetical protein [Geodermatophilus obscurus]|uniref:hypothetical protein n=1 Tax=Geodermatophilus obscurus TaxID=1861 RepID=UPI00019B8AE1|nr:hypothetical protein [Geodermatophilus obscurus]
MTPPVYVIEDREDRAARFLEAAVAARLNVLVSGGTHTGKDDTSLGRWLGGTLPKAIPAVPCCIP